MCDKCNKNLEKYKILYKSYADEIRNLWTRSIFLGAFMTLAWGGYGALQLKFITRKCGEFDMVTYCIASLGICLVIIVLSLLWVAMAKGSKFVQEAHEKHIENFINKNDFAKELYCNLDNNDIVKQIDTNDSLVFSGILSAFRYSPSRINILLGWISLVISFALALFYILNLLSPFFKPHPCVVVCGFIVIGIATIAIICSFCCMKDYLKGGN